MEKALIIIDYTYDFVAPNGRLTCGTPGQAIESKITSLVEQFIAEGEFVVFINDLHEENDIYHPETKLFPPHNIRGTKGRELFGKVKDVYEANKKNCVWLDKTRYSAFAGTNLGILLKERHINEIHLVGVCTDICVLHTAVDAYNGGYNMFIYRDGVASFNPIGHDWALQHFENTLGAKVL